jgi:tRNA pseudouridine38-40 synthase
MDSACSGGRGADDLAVWRRSRVKLSEVSVSPTFALTIAYDGTRYAGWQNQLNAISVQQRLEEAVQRAFGCQTPVVGSGRTDAGVHALGQVARLSLPQWPHGAAKLVPALNTRLPSDIVVRQARLVRPDFDPVRQATGKHYRYTLRAAACPDPMGGKYHWYFPRPLDVEAMRRAAERLLGCHDFASFQSMGSPRATTVRTVRELAVTERPAMEGREIHFDICADGFLYNMVRNIVGSLVEIGTGRFGAVWLEDALRAKDRGRAGQTAPPQGLCLMHVQYPASCFLEA